MARKHRSSSKALSGAGSRPAAAPAPAVPSLASAVDWSAVIAESRARAEAERPVEPRIGDLLQHPVLGQLEVLEVDDLRIEVRDRARNRRKLARPVLEFRMLGERHGKRVLRVIVRTA